MVGSRGPRQATGATLCKAPCAEEIKRGKGGKKGLQSPYKLQHLCVALTVSIDKQQFCLFIKVF